jgi:hypothetical protein
VSLHGNDYACVFLLLLSNVFCKFQSSFEFIVGTNRIARSLFCLQTFTKKGAKLLDAGFFWSMMFLVLAASSFIGFWIRVRSKP